MHVAHASRVWILCAWTPSLWSSSMAISYHLRLENYFRWEIVRENIFAKLLRHGKAFEYFITYIVTFFVLQKKHLKQFPKKRISILNFILWSCRIGAPDERRRQRRLGSRSIETARYWEKGPNWKVRWRAIGATGAAGCIAGRECSAFVMPLKKHFSLKIKYIYRMYDSTGLTNYYKHYALASHHHQ